MQDIFLSYAREDAARVEPLVELFEANGLSVWWDSNIVPGSTFENVIDEALMNSRMVVVVWTDNSIQSSWVQAEAGDALDRGILIPVMLDQVRVPVAFRRAQSVNLFGWPQRQDDRELQRLLSTVLARVDRDANEPKLPSPPTGGVAPRTGPWPILAAVTLALGLAAYFQLRQPEPEGIAELEGTVPRASIAVMPFEVADNAPVPDSYKGLAFEVADLLRRASELQVASEEQVAEFRSEKRRRARLDLGTDYQLTGVVDAVAEPPTGEHRLLVSLTDLRAGNPVWSQQYTLAP